MMNFGFLNRRKLLLFLAIASLLCLGNVFYSIVKWSYASADYEKIENALRSSDWGAANDETNKVMLRISRRNVLPLAHLFRNLSAVDSISCQHLKSIDSLWMSYSKKKFGLEKQSLLWREKTRRFEWEARRFNPDMRDFKQVEMAFDEITKRSNEFFSIDLEAAEPGQLPTQYWLVDGRLDGEYPVTLANYFFVHIENCKVGSSL